MGGGGGKAGCAQRSAARLGAVGVARLGAVGVAQRAGGVATVGASAFARPLQRWRQWWTVGQRAGEGKVGQWWAGSKKQDWGQATHTSVTVCVEEGLFAAT